MAYRVDSRQLMQAARILVGEVAGSAIAHPDLDGNR